MKLHVVIEVIEKKGDPGEGLVCADGRLSAYVVQEGRRGPEILTSFVSTVQEARIRVAAKLQGHEIEWAGLSPDYDLRNAGDSRIIEPRDRYGMKGVVGDQRTRGAQ